VQIAKINDKRMSPPHVFIVATPAFDGAILGPIFGATVLAEGA
jgi:hypothetical protein